jgi:hypothetical protein
MLVTLLDCKNIPILVTVPTTFCAKESQRMEKYRRMNEGSQN